MAKVLGVGGGELIGEVESYDFGSFGWFVDPDGNKVELWEPRFPERSADFPMTRTNCGNGNDPA